MSEQIEKRERRHRDWAGALASSFFCLVGAYIVVASFSMTKMAAVFPRTIGSVMVVLSLMQITAALTGRSGQSLEGGGSDFAEGRGRRVVLMVTMVAWALLFPFLGMFVTSLAACLVLMATGQFGRQSARQLGIHLFAVLAMVGIFYLLMTRILNIPMPRGLFF